MYVGERNEPVLVSLVRLTCTVHDAFFFCFLVNCCKRECRFRLFLLCLRMKSVQEGQPLCVSCSLCVCALCVSLLLPPMQTAAHPPTRTNQTTGPGSIFNCLEVGKEYVLQLDGEELIEGGDCEKKKEGKIIVED